MVIAQTLQDSSFHNCMRCKLSSNRKHNPIPGSSPCPLDEVRLIVVSSYPGAEEVRSGQSLSPSTGKNVNAGKILQTYLNRMSSGLYDYTYRTNCIKCPPRGAKGEELKQPRDMCKNWLVPEIMELPPNVPILLAGSEAVQSVLGKPLYDSRGEVYQYHNHPVVVTVNPIEVERATRFIHSSTGEVIGTPPIVGSIVDLWVRDIRLLLTLITPPI